MIIYIYGEDTFRSRQYLKEQVDRFKKTRDPQGYNTIFIDGKKSDPGKIVSEIITAPFLAEKRMVIIENILSCSDKALLGDLIARVKDGKIPDSNVVVVWQGEAIPKNKEAKELHDILKKEKYAQEFAVLEPARLRAWIENEMKNKGGKIGGRAAELLMVNCGGDMWALNSLLDQLCAYANGREIESSDVQKFLNEKASDDVFLLVEELVRGNKKQAYKLLFDLRSLGEDSFKIFGLVVWQFRNLISIRSLFESEDGLASDAMAKKLGLHPFVVKKNLSIAKRFSMKKLKEIYHILLDMDMKTKTGYGEPDLMLDLFAQKV
jgi:DNA polymerase-3 subunit delta